MLLPIPEEVLQAQARDRALDMLLGSLGVSAAIVSVSFATYMAIAAPPGHPLPGPAPLLSLAGTPTHGSRTFAPPVPSASDVAVSEPGDIDFDPTGSIAPLPAKGGATAASAAGRTVLPDFAVRDAFDGTALVEAHGTLRMVQPGAVIEGAGRVLSVSRRGSGWMVATTGGLILQRR